MNVATIPVAHLVLAFVPVLLVLVLMWHWGLNYRQAGYAVLRMLVQLMLIGYVLVYIFDAGASLVILGVLLVMVLASAWIALNTVEASRPSLLLVTVFALVAGGGSTLALVTQGVLQLPHWYEARYVIPLAGMIFANAMTSISLGAERLQTEMDNGRSFVEARGPAFQTAMIPVVNSLFAVGLVSLPGMMTGQILAGVSPFIAARYQIMVMCMIFSAAGISTAVFLLLAARLPFARRTG